MLRLTPGQANLYETWKRTFGLGRRHAGTLADLRARAQLPSQMRQLNQVRVLASGGFLVGVRRQQEPNGAKMRYYAVERPYRVS